MINVSVACCTYNGAHYLPEQLESLVRQTLPPDEIVVCDDGSTDDTREILLRYKREFPAIRWVLVWNGRRKGVRANFEQAIRIASGRYIATCDQDDIWKANKLERLLELLERTGCALAHSDVELIDAHGRVMDLSAKRCLDLERRRDLSDYILGANNVIGCTMMFRAELKKSLFPFPAYYYYHDQWLAIWAYHNGGICFVDEKLVGYRQHANNVATPLGGGGQKVRFTYRYFFGKSKDLLLVIKNGGGICLTISDTCKVMKRIVCDVLGLGYLKYTFKKRC